MAVQRKDGTAIGGRMRRFKSIHKTQRFLDAHAAVYKLFSLGAAFGIGRELSIFRVASFCVLGKVCSTISRISDSF